MGAGRPSKYDKSFPKIAKKMAELGATDEDIIEALGIGQSTFYKYRNEHREFMEALKVGKAASDDRVEMSLYKRAVGYEYEAVKIFNHQGKELVVPYTERQHPDVTAAIFWLKNRRPEQWRANPEDKPESTESQSLNITFEVAEPKKEIRVTKGEAK